MVDEESVRPTAVAGLFYPGDPNEVEATVRAHLEVGSDQFPVARGHPRRHAPPVVAKP